MQASEFVFLHVVETSKLKLYIKGEDILQYWQWLLTETYIINEV